MASVTPTCFIFPILFLLGMILFFPKRFKPHRHPLIPGPETSFEPRPFVLFTVLFSISVGAIIGIDLTGYGVTGGLYGFCIGSVFSIVVAIALTNRDEKRN